ncbi:MAG: PAS domain-containing protein [Actinomycetota bacterium]
MTDPRTASRTRREAPFRKLVEHLPALIYAEAVDANTDDFYLSPAAEQLLGYTPEDWTSEPSFWFDRIHPADLERVRDANREANLTRGPFSAEYRFRRADGTYVWVQDQATIVEDEDSRPFWQGIILDVTQRKATEEALLDAERRYREIVERTPAVTYQEMLTDGEWGATVVFVSPQVEAMLGYTPEQWSSDPGFWVSVTHPDDRERIHAESSEVIESGKLWRSDYRMIHRDGSVVWIHDEAILVTDDDGTGLYWQGFMLDVTEQREIAERLAETEAKYRAIVEQVPAVIYTQVIVEDDPGLSDTVFISAHNETLTGYTPAEIYADPGLWRTLLHPDDRDRVLADDAQVNATGDEVSWEYRMVHKDGHTVWVRDEARVIRDAEGRPRFWQGFMVDITEQKDAEERLAEALQVEREAAQRLRELDDMKNTFLQAVSHDLRTPLAAILGLAVTLERGDLDLAPHDAQDLARRIAQNARKLDRLVRDLLDLDRLSRGIVAPKLAPLDLGGLVRRVVAESDLITERDIALETERIVLPVDASKVERIVENLLANAARHTPQGTRVWVRVIASPDGAQIAVEDDGAGVSDADRGRIFEPFRQGPDAPTHSPGVGVGLTLVARFADLHGGRAWVQAREGGGASFRVFLPRHPAPAEDERPGELRSGA